MPDVMYDPIRKTQFMVPSIGYKWRTRDGGSREVSFGVDEITPDTIAYARSRAVECGWPGHPGTRWDYFKDDLRQLFGKTVHDHD